MQDSGMMVAVAGISSGASTRLRCVLQVRRSGLESRLEYSFKSSSSMAVRTQGPDSEPYGSPSETVGVSVTFPSLIPTNFEEIL